jgi:hypothetical protein
MSDTNDIVNRLRFDFRDRDADEVEEMSQEITRLRADLAQRTAERDTAIAERDEAVDALKRIATYDYRGNQSGESQIARHALIAMRKEGQR